MRDKLGTAKSIQEMKEICQTLKDRTLVKKDKTKKKTNNYV